MSALMTGPDETPPRIVARLRTLLPALIERSDGASQLQCLVRDISDTGAKLQLSDAVALPANFRMSIPKLGRQHEARIRWRRGDMVGVEFDPDDAAQRAARADDALVRRLEAENARLRKLIQAVRADPSNARLILDSE